MGSLGQIQKLAEYLARRTTERYNEQINLLPARSKTKKSGSSKIFKNEKTVPQNLAEYAVVKILSLLQTKKFDNSTIDQLTSLFLAFLAQPSSSGKTVSEKAVAKLGLDTFMNAKEECWCYSDFYTKPGRILNGIKYTSSSLLPELYGYSPTTEEEVQDQQLVLDSSSMTIEPSDKVVGPASPAHNKKLQDIAAHQEHISERQEFYAEMTRRTKEQNDQTTKKIEQLELTIQKLERLVVKSPEKSLP